MPNNILELKSISHSLTVAETGKREQVLHEISFEVPYGEFVSIVGPSGCGKSTLLRIIAGLQKPKHGKVHNEAKKMAMVFQNFAIFPWLSVEENVEFGLRMADIPEKERRSKVRELVHEVGLSGFEGKRPRELSGGMRQRVGIARALAVSPDLLLMDEPFSSLDEFTSERLRDELARLWQKYKMTVVMVTHLVEEAIELSDRIIVLSSRPGSLRKIETVHLPHPRQKRSEEYFTLFDTIVSEIEA